MTVARSFETVCSDLDLRRHVTLGFERIEALLDLLDHPERDLRVAQVVGTNGKGTTAVALAATLELAGHPSGVYLSPHVLSYVERMMVRGTFVSEGAFAATMGEVLDLADANNIPASQFELLTAGALGLFRSEGLSWAVLEAGLGARHDATTAARPEAVVLTNVGLEHTEYLGDTIEEIAREKLASVPLNGTLILGSDEPWLVGLARSECRRRGARLVEVSPDSDPPHAPTVTYAARNVALGIRAAEVLLDREFGPGDRKEVFERVSGALPARFERHEVRGVPVVVDGGHNPAGLAAALGAVREIYGDRPLGVVFGALRDKDIGSMLTALKNEASSLALTRPVNERAANPGWVLREFDPRDREGRSAAVVADSGEALERVVEEMKQAGGVVLVTGSLYTAAEVLGRLREG
ncbi:MAG: Mur ligase family protein [Actinomycetota bacterium]|nr:Mur ligase family protein [Actinomycetota bacterium]